MACDETELEPPCLGLSAAETEGGSRGTLLQTLDEGKLFTRKKCHMLSPTCPLLLLERKGDGKHRGFTD